MGVNYIIIQALASIAIGVIGVYLYLSVKKVISKIDHDNGNLKFLGNNIYKFHTETDDKLNKIIETQALVQEQLKQINQTIDEFKKCKQK